MFIAEGSHASVNESEIRNIDLGEVTIREKEDYINGNETCWFLSLLIQLVYIFLARNRWCFLA